MKEFAVRIVDVNNMIRQKEKEYKNDTSLFWPGRYVWPRTDYTDVHSVCSSWIASESPYMVDLREAEDMLEALRAETSGFVLEIVRIRMDVIKTAKSFSPEESGAYFRRKAEQKEREIRARSMRYGRRLRW